ncbi:transcription/translation regulatory transformer protein RfaH [Kangiella sp. TOML190]|uniref:transcription/translation regulatory transformer protein RfaH n=1 Tax=Kangiella sp. TOML190 TaxID=2931351 RepID=UPI00203BFB66|nr:transcription/translation regulatory transformer protein RfaH [Kangiella sp. TOML190]
MTSWYLIQAKPKQQAKAKEHLDNQGIENFYPTIEIEKIIRGKRQKVLEPLFANYIFVRLDDEAIGWSKIRSTRGVRDFVRFGSQVAKVPEPLIESIKQDVSSLTAESIESNVPKVGEKVKITDGVFKDLEGIYKAKNGEERSIILLTVLNKVTELEILNTQVAKLED